MIAIAQTHKQNIAVIKCDRDAIGLSEDQYKAFFLSLFFGQYFLTHKEDFRRIFWLASAAKGC